MQQTTDQWEPSFSEEEVPTLRAGVYQAVGAASTCWDPSSGERVFDSEQAIQVAEGLLSFISSLPKTEWNPGLLPPPYDNPLPAGHHLLIWRKCEFCAPGRVHPEARGWRCDRCYGFWNGVTP